MIKKLFTIITLLCFAHVSFGAPCVQGALELAAQIQAVDAVVTFAGSSEDPFNLRLPSTLGRVTSGRNVGQGPIVINIQDLHCHAEVQRNISGILQFLDKKYGLRDVFVEGGYGRLNTAWLDGIADPGLKKQMANALLENGRLGGSEYFALTNGRHDLLTGLEDERLHKANIVRLGSILERQPRFEGKLKELRRDLVVMKACYLSAENKRLEKILEQYRAGDMTDARLYALLSAYIDKVHARPEAYHCLQVLRKESFPTVQLYRETLALQKHLRYSKVSAQLTAFIGTLKTRLSFAAYNDLLTNTDNLNDLDALAAVLARVSRDHQLNIGARYPDLAQFIAYREKTRAVNPMVLLRETRRMTDALRSAFAHNSAERDIAFLCDTFDCFEDYLLNRLTAEDYTYFKPRFEQFASLWGAYTYTNHIRDLAPDFPLLDAYYAANDRRNSVFIDTMAPVLRARAAGPKAASAPAIVVMVSGGFHTDGIARLLAQRNISYCTVTPAVTRPADAARHVFEETIRYQSRLFGAQALSGTPLGSLAHKVDVTPDGGITLTLDGGARFIVEGDSFRVEGDVDASKAIASARDLDFEKFQQSAKIILQNAGIVARLVLTHQTPLSIVPAFYALVDILGDMLARKGAAGTGLLWDIASNTAVQHALAEEGISLDSISTWLEPLQALAAGYAVTQADVRAMRDDPSTNSIVRAVLHVPYVIETLGALHVFTGPVGADEYGTLGEAVDRLIQIRDSSAQTADAVVYTAVMDKDGNVRFTGDSWPDSAAAIVLFNSARADRPGVVSQPADMLDPDEIEASPSVQKLYPSNQAASPLARWLSVHGTPWYVKPNDFPHWRGEANYVVFARADTNPDGTDVPVGQREMSSLQNIKDVLDFQHALNESLPADAPRYTAGVNGWFYDRIKGAVRAGATQNWAHAQLFRQFLPIASAATRRVGTLAGGVDVDVLSEEGLGSAVVLEADAGNRDELASAMHSLIRSITDQGHSFNYLVVPSGKRLRVFVFDRVLTRLPGFDDEAGFGEVAGMMPFSDPAKFFALEPGEQVDRAHLAAWARARAASATPRLNEQAFRKARAALPQLTASRPVVEQRARDLIAQQASDIKMPVEQANRPVVKRVSDAPARRQVPLTSDEIRSLLVQENPFDNIDWLARLVTEARASGMRVETPLRRADVVVSLTRNRGENEDYEGIEHKAFLAAVDNNTAIQQAADDDYLFLNVVVEVTTPPGPYTAREEKILKQKTIICQKKQITYADIFASRESIGPEEGMLFVRELIFEPTDDQTYVYLDFIGIHPALEGKGLISHMYPSMVSFLSTYFPGEPLHVTCAHPATVKLVKKFFLDIKYIGKNENDKTAAPGNLIILSGTIPHSFLPTTPSSVNAAPPSPAILPGNFPRAREHRGDMGVELTLPSTYRFAAWIAGILHLPFAQDLPPDWYAPENKAHYLQMSWFAERVVAPLAVWDLPWHLGVSVADILRGNDVKKNLIRVAGAVAILSATAGLILLADGFMPVHVWTDLLAVASVGLIPYAGLHRLYNRLFGTGTRVDAPLAIDGHEQTGVDDTLRSYVEESGFYESLGSYAIYDIDGEMIDTSENLIAVLKKRSKGVMTIDAFARTHFQDVRGGYALGLTASGSIYHVLSKFFGLASWETGYKEVKIDDGMGLDHIQRYMDAITSTGKPVVFFVPSHMNTRYGYITQAELRWMAQSPEKLGNVYFVFGAYDHYFPPNVPGMTVGSIRAMFKHATQDILRGRDPSARAAALDSIHGNYAHADERAARSGAIHPLLHEQQIVRLVGLLSRRAAALAQESARQTDSHDNDRTIAPAGTGKRKNARLTSDEIRSLLEKENPLDNIDWLTRLAAEARAAGMRADAPLRRADVTVSLGRDSGAYEDFKSAEREAIAAEVLNNAVVKNAADDEFLFLNIVMEITTPPGPYAAQEEKSLTQRTLICRKSLLENKDIFVHDTFVDTEDILFVCELIFKPTNEAIVVDLNLINIHPVLEGKKLVSQIYPAMVSFLSRYFPGAPMLAICVADQARHLVKKHFMNVTEVQSPIFNTFVLRGTVPNSVPTVDSSKVSMDPQSPAILPKNRARVQERIQRMLQDNQELPAAERLSDDQIERAVVKDVQRWEWLASLSPLFAWLHPRGARAGAALVTASFWGTTIAVGALALGVAHTVMLPGIGLFFAFVAGVAAGFAVREAVHVNIDVHFIRSAGLVSALREWGGVDMTGNTLSAPVWMTHEGDVMDFSRTVGETPIPLSIYVRVNGRDEDSHQVYAVVTRGYVVLGFAEKGLDIDPVVVTREISCALVARDGLDGNPTLNDRMRQVIAAAAEGSGITGLRPDALRFAQPILVGPSSSDGRVSFKEGVMVVPAQSLPADTSAARAVLTQLNQVNVSMGKHVVLDARAFADNPAETNTDELIRQTGTASLILTKDQIAGIDPERLADIAAAGKYIYVSGDGYEGDVERSKYVTNMHLAGYMSTDSKGVARLYGEGAPQQCDVVRGTIEDVRAALDKKAHADSSPAVIIALDAVLAQDGRADIMQLPALMDTLRQYLFDALEQDAAFRQSIDQMINPQNVEAILRSA